MFKTEDHWLKVVGGAILVSIACIDPGNLQGDIQVSQAMGYKSIWVLLFAHIMLYFFQEMAIMIGCQSTQDLGRQISQSYSKPTAFLIWFSAELAIIAADVQEILGASIALKLLFGLSNLSGLPIIIGVVILMLYLQQFGQQVMELVFLIFVSLMAMCFIANFIMISPDWKDLANGFIPNTPKTLEFTAVIGSIIMPQNLFLHSSLVLTRNQLNVSTNRLIDLLKIETVIVLILSFVINLSIVSVFADPHYAGKQIDLENAGHYLKHFLPSLSASLWAIGLLCSGISATATGALTGQFLMEGIFDIKISRTIRILLTRLITVVPCVIIILYFDVNRTINLLNIIQFIELPFVIIPLLRFVASRGIMGKRCFSNFKWYALVSLSLFLQIINLFSLYSAVGSKSAGSQIVYWALVTVQTVFLSYLALVKISEHKPVTEIVMEDLDDEDEEDEVEKRSMI